MDYDTLEKLWERHDRKLREKQAQTLLVALRETTQMLRDAVPTYHRPVEMQARIQANGALLALMGAGDE